MSLSKELGNALRQVYFGGNWTVSNLQDKLSDVSFEEASKKIHDLNSILTLTYHIYYYTKVQLAFFKTGKLVASDKESFHLPEIKSESDWNELKAKVYSDVEELASCIEKIEEQELSSAFADDKYGSYFRNLEGNVQHTHYHLGQIVIIKKLIRNK